MADEPEGNDNPPPSTSQSEPDPLPPDSSASDQKPFSESSFAPVDTATTAPSPVPPGSSASVRESVADSIETATPTLGGSNQTQVNVVNRGFTPRPSTGDKPNSHQFYANLPTKRYGTTDVDNESLVSRSTAQRTNFSSMTMGGSRRPPSRSHIPAIMPAYSFYHPLRPPAVANASGQQQIPQTETKEEETEARPTTSPQTEEVSSVHGKPSTEPLLPRPAVIKQETRQLHPVMEAASTRTSMLSSHLLGTSAPVIAPFATPMPQENNDIPRVSSKTRNWQHFPGKTKYHLNGRLQFGTQYLANIVTATLILIPTGLYFGFTYSSPTVRLRI